MTKVINLWPDKKITCPECKMKITITPSPYKGGSARAVTAGVGGDFYNLGEDVDGLSFQPLALIGDELERSWATEWILDLLRRENIEITPTVKQEVWIGLTSLATAPVEQRTISGLIALLQDNILRQALHSYSIDGPHGHLLDATGDSLSYGKWQCFEMEHIMNTPAVVPAVLAYLFHRLEKRFDGKPTVLVFDEAGFHGGSEKIRPPERSPDRAGEQGYRTIKENPRDESNQPLAGQENHLPGMQNEITITPSPYKEYHCPGCGEIFTVVSEDDELFRECEEEDDP